MISQKSHNSSYFPLFIGFVKSVLPCLDSSDDVVLLDDRKYFPFLAGLVLRL